MSETAAAPAVNTATPETSAPAAPAPSDWTTGLNDDTRGYVQNKGFKDPGAVLDSYRNLEKLMGLPAENVLKLPVKDDDVDGWNKVHAKLGRPEKADEYQIAMPEKGGDPAFAKWAKEQFHGLGLSKKQGETLAAKWTEFMGGQVQAQTADLAAKGQAAESGLKKEWGAAYEQNMAMVERAANTLGMDDKVLHAFRDSMGGAEAAKFIHGLSQKLGEGKFVSGEGNQGFGGALTPSQAQQQLQSLRSDPDFVRRYTAGGSKEKAEMDRLHQFAYPSEG